MTKKRQLYFFSKFLNYLKTKKIETCYDSRLDDIIKKVDRFLSKHQFYEFDAKFYSFKKIVELGR